MSYLDEKIFGVGVPLANTSTGTINNVVASDANGVPVGAIRFSGAAPVVTGLIPTKRPLFVMATGGDLTLNDDDSASVATNRIVTGIGAPVTVPEGSAAILVYDTTSARWRLSSASASAMTPADKTKLDGIQKQGAATAVSAFAIDWSLGGVYTKTLAAGANAFTFTNAASGMMITVRVTGAASTLTWPTVLWAGGAAPTQTASGKDVYTFVHDGTNIYGSVQQAFA